MTMTFRTSPSWCFGVRGLIPAGRRYLTLGTDGFGRSDTRAALREFFRVDADSIVKAAKHALGVA